MLAFVAAPVAVAGQAKNDDKDIIVDGRQTVARAQARAFVEQISVRTDTQLARFHQPVCPLVSGLPEPYAEMIASRVRDDALAIGLQIAKKRRCNANLIVVFVPDGGAWVKAVRSMRPGWVEGLSKPDVDKLTEPAPVRAWSVTSLRNDIGGALYIPPAGEGLEDKPVLRVILPSLVRESTRRDTEASFVVLDQAATIGLTLRQIADYVAMRGLALTRPPVPGSSVPTILSLFDAGSSPKPDALTEADIGYLQALYEGKGYETVLVERSRIVRRLAGEK
jgi:hypothetical protein